MLSTAEKTSYIENIGVDLTDLEANTTDYESSFITMLYELLTSARDNMVCYAPLCWTFWGGYNLVGKFAGPVVYDGNIVTYSEVS